MILLRDLSVRRRASARAKKRPQRGDAQGPSFWRLLCQCDLALENLISEAFPSTVTRLGYPAHAPELLACTLFQDCSPRPDDPRPGGVSIERPLSVATAPALS